MTVVIEERLAEVEAPDEASLLLERAADLIEDNGWCVGSYRDLKGRMCLLGALARAAERAEFSRKRGDAEGAAYDRLNRRLPGGAVTWNDHHCRDQREAVRVLREAAAR